MIEIIYLIPLLIILIIVLFSTIISLKNNNKFLIKSTERKDLKIKELKEKLHDAEDAFAQTEKAKKEIYTLLETNSELLSQEKDINENLLKLIAEMKKAKPEKDEDVIIEYFLKSKK